MIWRRNLNTTLTFQPTFWKKSSALTSQAAEPHEKSRKTVKASRCRWRALSTTRRPTGYRARSTAPSWAAPSPWSAGTCSARSTPPLRRSLPRWREKIQNRHRGKTFWLKVVVICIAWEERTENKDPTQYLTLTSYERQDEQLDALPLKVFITEYR